MGKSIKKYILPDEVIMNKILIIRGKKVMIDRDLAELYGVSTKQLNQQVKRNIARFPADFMFKLTKKEKEEVVTNCDHLKILKFSPSLPFAFTEYGAIMLANVLNSDKAIQVNIQIVKVFTKMKEMLLSNKEILLKLEKMEKDVKENKEDIAMIFEALKQLLNPAQPKRRMIGFNRKDDE
jgi:phage regulator Rha-like protein